jgi:hypothetical protein
MDWLWRPGTAGNKGRSGALTLALVTAACGAIPHAQSSPIRHPIDEPLAAVRFPVNRVA